MEPDPIGLEGGLNPYAYCYNNPVNNVDPSGLIVTVNEKPIGPGASVGGVLSINTLTSLAGHTWLNATPDNPKQFQALNPEVPMINGSFTIGGYPQSNADLSIRGSSPLVFQFNGDTGSQVRQSANVAIPQAFYNKATAQYSADTLFITALVRNAQAFNSHYINYQGTAGQFQVPGAGRIDRGVDYYNSNSFTSGLLQSVGANTSFDPWGYQPGFSKPVPEYNFNWSNP